MDAHSNDPKGKVGAGGAPGSLQAGVCGRHRENLVDGAVLRDLEVIYLQ